MAKKKFSAGLTVVSCFLALVIGFAAAFFLYTYLTRPKGGDVYVSGDLSIHFMELGNKYAGDSIYIKAGDTDILIDAGSRAGSTETTSAYIDRYCTDGVLEYVIATHADQDHIAGFAGSSSSPSIFERYECEVIIDFPRTDKTSQTYQKYVENRDAEVEAGAKHYTALQCCNNEDGAQRVFEVSDGIEMEILYNYYYENSSPDENNYSVCLMFNQGDKHFLFTGDLEEEGEKYLVENNDLPEVELFKAGHHVENFFDRRAPFGHQTEDRLRLLLRGHGRIHRYSRKPVPDAGHDRPRRRVYRQGLCHLFGRRIRGGRLYFDEREHRRHIGQERRFGKLFRKQYASQRHGMVQKQQKNAAGVGGLAKSGRA